MNCPILYLGDTSLHTAASYLAGCLHANGWNFDYLPSDRPVLQAHLDRPYQLYIVSDYPAVNLQRELQQKLASSVHDGANLLMIGGWESFHGLGGDWDGTPLGDILPVKIGTDDDRQNCDSPVFLRRTGDHPITASLPWNERVPLIGGYNRVTVKPGTQTLLTADRFGATSLGNQYRIAPVSSEPLLVVDDSSPGRVSALMTDLAPHWVGPFVDWGDDRVKAHAPGSEAVEVGSLYFQFVSQLIAWAGRFV